MHTIDCVRENVSNAKKNGQRVSFVPTMGALHDGHLSLVEVAKRCSNYVVMSVFVNPTQFNDPRDLVAYPRMLEEDIRKATNSGVDLLFAPSEMEMYPSCQPECISKSCKVLAGSRADGLCGATRPGHFDGVVTVVSKLFNIVQADVAVFGEKDYQQASVIKQMVQDLHIPIEIITAPLVRELDGLAMSSRNLLLSAEDRKSACEISKTLFAAKDMVSNGQCGVSDIRDYVSNQLLKTGKLAIDYISIVDTITLDPIDDKIVNSAQLLVAVFCGGVRLIDNVRCQIAN